MTRTIAIDLVRDLGPSRNVEKLSWDDLTLDEQNKAILDVRNKGKRQGIQSIDELDERNIKDRLKKAIGDVQRSKLDAL